MKRRQEITKKEDLKPEYMLDLLLAKYAKKGEFTQSQIRALKINELSFYPMDDGVMSSVFNVSVVFDDAASEEILSIFPKRFVAKFRKEDLENKNMFINERSFYYFQKIDVLMKNHDRADFDNKKLSSSLVVVSDDAFGIPKAVYCSDSFILLERIENIEKFPTGTTCPNHFLQAIFMSLGKMHGENWQYDTITTSRTDGFVVPAGIGSVLDAKTKEQTFPRYWKEFLNDIRTEAFDTKDIEYIEKCCQELATRRMKGIHDAFTADDGVIHTFIHGDFHAGNILFQISSNTYESMPSSREVEKIWLCDWGVCGKGHPIRDVVFFLLVSCSTSTFTNESGYETIEGLLKTYYRALTSDTIPKRAAILSVFSYKKFFNSFRRMLVNQFIILVCYDKFTKDFVKTKVNECDKKKLMDHFREVNIRSARSLLRYVRLNDITEWCKELKNESDLHFEASPSQTDVHI